MEKVFIRGVEDKLFCEFWMIYQSSFPTNEKRTKENFSLILSGESCKLLLYTIDNKVAGFFVYWYFPNFIYIEYLATNPALRNQGIGSKMIKDFISSADKPLILEIDEMSDPISRRRHNFYTREGFILNSHSHTPTAYDNKSVKLNLHIMSYPNTLSNSEYNSFNDTLIAEVMSNLYDRSYKVEIL